jgi:GNAT superfamily N-acetyltransferase
MIIREATPADVQAIARVHVDSWRTTYRGLVRDEYLAKLSYEARERFWGRILSPAQAGRQVVFVAQAESGQIAGFVDGGKPLNGGDPAYKSELYAIYLLEPFQGQGTGRRLVQALAQRLHQAGFGSMMLWVMEGNPAERFYQRLGGKRLSAKSAEVGGVTVQEIAYGWPDIRTLFVRTEA